jgi:hypothetical protein
MATAALRTAEYSSPCRAVPCSYPFRKDVAADFAWSALRPIHPNGIARNLLRSKVADAVTVSRTARWPTQSRYPARHGSRRSHGIPHGTVADAVTVSRTAR